MNAKGILPVSVFIVAVAVLAPRAGAQSIIWELSAYRVKVVVAVEPTPEATPALIAELTENVREHIGNYVGAAWDAEVAPAEGARARLILEDFEGVTKDDLPYEERRDFDKIICVSVGLEPGNREIRAREFDVKTERFSTPVSRPLAQMNKLEDAVFRTILEAFAPLAIIQKSEKADDGSRTVWLRLRAAGLPIRDPDLQFVREKDLFLPIVRYNDREGNARRITAIEWTYFEVREIKSDSTVCDVTTGLRSPLTGRRRGRVERYALLVKAPKKPTTLILQGQKPPHDRLCGYEAFVKIPGVKMPKRLGRTNLAGEIVIPPGKERVREVLVKNGGSILARLPMLPGLNPTQVAYIPNDDSRLEAEGFLKGLQEELIDVVVRREILKARIKKRLESGKLEGIDELVARLGKLPTRDEFLLELTKAKNRLISENETLQKRIDAMFAKTEILLGGQLDPDEINQITHDVMQSKRQAPKEPAKSDSNGPEDESEDES